jgi:hypothetical protein
MSADRKFDIAADQIARISDWVDTSPTNATRDREALGWHRVAKAAEEAGEAISEWLQFTGGNPRKPASPGDTRVVEELLDTALAALCAVEHLRGNRGVALNLLADKIERVWIRAQAVEL